jgi:hypothetical protein
MNNNRKKNIALGIALFTLALIFYCVTILKF